MVKVLVLVHSIDNAMMVDMSILVQDDNISVDIQAQDDSDDDDGLGAYAVMQWQFQQ